MDTPLTFRRSHGGVQGGHRGSEEREGVQARRDGTLCERPDRQEDRGRPRWTVRRPAGLQAPDHGRERQGRLPDAARPARAAEEAPPPERRRGLPSQTPGRPEEEDGSREHGIAGHPAAEPDDRPARAEVDRGRLAGAGAMKVSGQPEVNMGVVGHVDHGKSTLTERLTEERTDRHSEEIRRGISIRLGYADMAIYKCPKDSEPAAYSNTEVCKTHNVKGELQRIVSFVDSPGHETLMATMLSGAAIMDGALLVIAANEEVPQPQTKEHLMALGIIGVDKIVIVQNKIDIVDPKQAEENYKQILSFVKGTVAQGAPIVPVSAHHDVNLDALMMMIQKIIPTPKREEAKPAKMYVARSFDVNQPGIGPEKIVGGVLGGSLIQGRLRGGDEIEISPGRQVTVGNKTEWKNLTTSIRSLHSGGASRKDVRPGGLIAIGTNLDPVLTKSDGLVGRVVGPPGSLPEVLMKMTVEVNLLERVVGVAEDLKVEGIKTSEPLMVSVGTATTVGVVTSARENRADMGLKIPVVAEPGQRVAVSRRIGGKWRLIWYGVVRENFCPPRPGRPPRSP